MTSAVFAEKKLAAPASRAKAASKATSSNLRIGPPNDYFEQEADRIADEVMAGGAKLDWSFSRISIDPPLQRKCSCGGSGGSDGQCEECKEKEQKTLQRKASGTVESDVAPPIVHEVLNSPGQPLDQATRNFFEPRFGYDFSNVRIHADARAAESARAVGAVAYTVGRDVVFGGGRYAPASGEGRRLVAHELAHAAQQTSGPAGAAHTANDEHAPPARLAARIGASSCYYIARQSDPDAGTLPSHELTEQDAKTCSPLYLQKLCVFIEAGLGGDRSGVETPEEMAAYDRHCRAESGYADPDPVQLSSEERAALRAPKCDRGDPESARKRARSANLTDIVDRSVRYMPGAIGEQLAAIVKDPIFLGSLALAVGVYLALWIAPEPIFTKIAAAATTIAILSTGAFTISTILNLARAWGQLEDDADSVQTSEEKEEAAKRFGKSMGEVEANLLVFLASLLVGGKVPGPKRMPPAAQALAEAERALASTEPGGVVIRGPWGQARALPPPGPEGVPPRAFKGNNALKIETAPAPVEPAKAIPLPVPKPAAATAPAQAPLPAQPPMPVMPVVPGLGPKPEKEPCGPLPIRWPTLLPLPDFVRDLKRTGREERESEGIERGREQAAFRNCLNDARNRPHPLDPAEHCKDFGAWFDPKLAPGAPADAHHMHPLYLGGEDAVYNLGALDPSEHQVGHRRLDDQSSMLGTPEWQACKPISPALKNHPVNQEYYIEGKK